MMETDLQRRADEAGAEAETAYRRWRGRRAVMRSIVRAAAVGLLAFLGALAYFAVRAAREGW